MNIDLRLSVEDSLNSAGEVIALIRCCTLALKAKKEGVLYSPSAYVVKHPPRQFTYEEGYRMVERFIAGEREGYFYYSLIKVIMAHLP